MSQRSTLLYGAIAGFLSVALGAFGAHGLKNFLVMNNHLDTYNLAVEYQFYHALTLLIIGTLIPSYPKVKGASILFVLGIILFSGSLYMLSLTDYKWFGFVTPLGGFLFIAGWLIVIYGVYTKASTQ